MLFAVATLTGCVIAVNTDDWENDWHTRQHENAEKIDQLELGRTEGSVRTDFGKPDFVESFLRNGDAFTVLYYRTRRVESDGVTSKDETTPLVFVDGVLVGWGDAAIDHATAGHATVTSPPGNTKS